MNYLKNGTLKVGAPGSFLRKMCELVDENKGLKAELVSIKAARRPDLSTLNGTLDALELAKLDLALVKNKGRYTAQLAEPEDQDWMAEAHGRTALEAIQNAIKKSGVPLK